MVEVQRCPEANFNFELPADFARHAEKLAARWDDWYGGDPHLSFSWLRLLADTATPPDVRLALLDCHGEGAARPSYLALLWNPLQASEILSFANFYTPLFGFVGGGLPDTERLASLLSLLRLRKLPIHELRFWPLARDEADFEQLNFALRMAGWWVGTDFCFGNWFHRLEGGGYKTYLDARPSRLKNTLRRAETRFRREKNGEIRVFQGNEIDFESAIEQFVKVYNRSWKKPEPFPNFIPGLCRWAAGVGGLRLGVLSIDGRAVAVQLWLVAGKSAYIVKLAYDPEYSHLSPGTLLTAGLMQQVIDDDKVAEIDYLIGDDTYKQDWMTQRRERWSIVANNPGTLKGVLLALRHKLGQLRRSRC